jgi:hypothetical protein
MRHPAAINSASTNTLYKPRYPWTHYTID